MKDQLYNCSSCIFVGKDHSYINKHRFLKSELQIGVYFISFRLTKL